MRLVFWSAFWTFLVDQATKYLVVHLLNLRLLGEMDVFPPYLNLRMAWNRGINFGLFQGDSDAARWILIAIALAVVAFVVVWMRRERPGRWGLISGGVLIGGAMGNVVDRLLYGAVADFLNMSCCGIENPFAFNVADVAIFAGAIGLIVFGGAKKAP
ncbi:signal peptidase II [Salinihabitans flavidus]|uniref:Lipoprotein signal peptidase n=1 Tax=Salinihabitans flavidus TaxID=569882 RepID=A0A1H8S2U1_9RHOB|nr:signal peptidase II [Salinihabitans flavidus]SEO72744.1 signal peptidase II [Salinihabitans flavidus]